MDSLNKLMDKPRNLVKSGMNVIAKGLNSATDGRVSPSAITIVGLLAHLPIAWLIATRHNNKAALLLVVFGLFDALDGSLARLQGKASNAGMLLDASTDRMKEVMLYTGVAYSLVAQGLPYWAVWAVVACGASLVVSYVKAKGETAVKGMPANEVNRLFQDGLMRFEIRMLVLVVGLLSNRLPLALVVIAITSSLTAIGRLRSIMKKL